MGELSYYIIYIYIMYIIPDNEHLNTANFDNNLQITNEKNMSLVMRINENITSHEHNDSYYYFLNIILFFGFGFCITYNLCIVLNRRYLKKYTRTSTTTTSNLIVVLPESNEICSICLQVFNENEILLRLPCQHKFHNNCINTWLNNNQSCPLCRATLS